MRVRFPYTANIVAVLMSILVLLNCKIDNKSFASCPLIWNVNNLQELKNKRGNEKLYNNIIKISDKYCSQSPVVVTEKQKTYAPNNHYYCSIGIYWWPNPQDPNGKYINKDGLVNPESNEFDLYRIGELSKRCKYLSVAFYLTNDRKYYDAFMDQINAWFLNRTTYMYPNLEYAQVIPGYNNNKGRTTGTIDAYSFNDVLESIRLINTIEKIDKETIKELQKWFRLFAIWLNDSGFVYKLSNSQNNISLAFDITLCNIYLFIGDDGKAQKIINGFYDKRILSQISENGEQPAEIVRTKAFSYSLYNLKHILDFCYLARIQNKSYYSQYGQLVDKAFEFLLEFIDKPEDFPYQQISSWDDCRYDLGIELIRRNRLANNKLDNSSMMPEKMPLDDINNLLK